MKNIIRFAMSALLALGFAYIAKSQACVGDGSNSIEDTITSSAFGVKNTVYGKSSTAIGTSNTVSVKNSSKSAFAIGDANQATAKLTFALGDYNKVTKAYSFAIGSTNTVNANTSIAIGCWLKNTVDHGITIGFGSQKSLPLVNNTDGIMMGMNSDKPTFFISSSSCDGGTGRVGIGNVTSPQAKLHIKADNYSYDGEDADILLEPTRANKIAVIYFKDKNNSIAVSGSQMTFTAPKYSFTNAGITLGKNATTKNPEISFGGANKISVGTDSNTMSFTAGGFSFESQTSMNFISNDFIFVPRREMLVNGSLRVNRSVILTELAGDTARRMVCVNSEGCLETMNVSSVRDNMGNHVAERNIHLNGFKLVNSKDDGGIFLDGNNRVGIGTSTPLYELSVNGTILAKELIVSKLDEDWPDYVFDPEYKLTSLEELGSYVKDERHLPGVPSAKEMEDGGIKVGEMNAILLKKIEELTLYVIELQQQINELKGEQK